MQILFYPCHLMDLQEVVVDPECVVQEEAEAVEAHVVVDCLGVWVARFVVLVVHLEVVDPLVEVSVEDLVVDSVVDHHVVVVVVEDLVVIVVVVALAVVVWEEVVLVEEEEAHHYLVVKDVEEEVMVEE